MAEKQHSTLTDPELHEPKGAAAASASEVLVADGAGGTVWQKISSAEVSEVTGFVVAEMPDISAPSSIYVPFTKASTIVKVTCVTEDNITAADTTITFYDNVGASMGNIVVAFTGSAAGTIDTLNSPVNNEIPADSFMRITTDGASSTTCRAQFMIEFTSEL